MRRDDASIGRKGTSLEEKFYCLPRKQIRGVMAFAADRPLEADLALRAKIIRRRPVGCASIGYKLCRKATKSRLFSSVKPIPKRSL